MKISSDDFRRRLLPILFTQFLGITCGIAGVRLTSFLVTPADYGVYGVFVSLSTIGMWVVYAGLVKFVGRHWQAAEDRAGLMREVLTASGRRLPWLLAAVAVSTLAAAPDHPWIFGGALFLSAVLLYFAQIVQTALQAARDHWRDFAISAGMTVTRAFGPPLLYAATGAGVAALLGGFCFQAVVGALLAGWMLRRWWRPDPVAPRARMLTPVYDGPLFVALAVAGWILSGMNRWLATSFFDRETAGYFTLASNIGTILPSILGVIMLQYLQPVWYAAETQSLPARKKLLGQVDRMALLYTALALTAALLLHLLMPRLIGPLVNIRYATAATFVLAAGFSTAALTIGFFYHALLLAAKREKACGPTDLSGAACLIVGGVASAAAGLDWFRGWLVFSPLVPWLVNRTVARRRLLTPD